MTSKHPGISAIIPNYNGIEYLQKCIPALSVAFQSYLGSSEIIVVDNGSKDESLDYLRSEHPYVELIEFADNKGFAIACNEGAHAAQHEFLLLLNNDVYVTKDFIKPLIKHFETDVNRELFGVSCKLLLENPPHNLYFGRTLPSFKLGLFEVRHPGDIYDTPQYTLYPSGGASLVYRARYLELGGFDPDMFYFEDVDLGYRAWKRAWKTIYEPRSVVFHKAFGTSEKVYGFEKTRFFLNKGRLLFVWKNIFDKGMLAKHILLLPIAFYSFTKQYRSFPRSVGGALLHASHVLRERAKQKRTIAISDKEAFMKIQATIATEK